METNTNNSLIPRFHYLWILSLSYTSIILLANWFDGRLVQLFGFITDAGTLIFPLTFLLSDLITEIYGYKHARRAIWAGLLFNFFYIFYGQLIIHLPSPDIAVNNLYYDKVINIDGRIILASTLSYLCAEPLNSFVLSKMKLKTNGRLLALRFIISTLLAAGVDSSIFSVIAFYNLMPYAKLITFILTMWVIKVLIEVIGLPFSLYFTKIIKHRESLDIFDRDTSFTLFSLDYHYPSSSNYYKIKDQ